MFITEEECGRRLASSKNLRNILGLKNPEKGPQNNGGAAIQGTVITEDTISEVRGAPKFTNTPPLQSDNLRVIAGTVGKILGDKEAASSLGITENQVKSAKNSKKFASLIEQRIIDVEELALQRTLEAMGLLTPESMSTEKPHEIAFIAQKMAMVAQSIRRQSQPSDNRTQFIVFAPSLKQENNYEVIESDVA